MPTATQDHGGRPVDLVRSRLQGLSTRIESDRGDDFMAQCPSHDDRTPSLHVSTDDGGDAVIYCHAGCAPEVVLDAIGLRFTDLFVDFAAGFEKPDEAVPGSQWYKGQGARDQGLGMT